jgi:aminotransferase
MAATFLALVEPGDEVLMFEPFYENYRHDAYVAGATPRTVSLRPPTWELDVDLLEASITDRTRALVMTNPHNPTGKVFDSQELAAIADVATNHDLLVFPDEIYEHIVYDGRAHHPIALLPGMADRTITINALSKTYSVTGWRVGWAIGPEQLIAAIRKVHDFLTVGAPTPLQAAGVVALQMPDAYYDDLAREYQQRRDLFVPVIQGLGFECATPAGAYYALCDASALRRRLGESDDIELCSTLAADAGVATVPGSSFFVGGPDGRDFVRFAFPKRLATLEQAVDRLKDYLGH